MPLSEELKPCPFCGDPVGEASFWYCRKPAPPERYHVFCLECEFDGPGGDTLDEAITAWNQRAQAEESAVYPVPAGWALVPVEPTEEMSAAVNREFGFSDGYKSAACYAAPRVWRVMLDAAPKAAEACSTLRPAERERDEALRLLHERSVRMRGYLDEANARIRALTAQVEARGRQLAWPFAFYDQHTAAERLETLAKLFEQTVEDKLTGRVSIANPEQAVADIRALIKAQEWRPIETAPRDGTRFLAYQETRESPRYECWWQDDFTNWSGWLDVWDSEPEPTHWMPLPTPPKA